MEIIPGKITIPIETPSLSRLRLVETLQESLDSCGATVITGRAGTGKTALAADFARHCGRRVAWYKVDAPDADLRIFLRYLVAGVARQRPEFGDRLLARFGPPANGVNLSTLAEAFVFDLQKHCEPLLLVIDDLHLVYDADWTVPFFHRLLPLLPAEVHLMTLGRGLPPAPLWRLRSKQRLRVIDEAALAFTPEEAKELFAGYGLEAKEAAAALAQTRGRADALSVRAWQGARVKAASSPERIPALLAI
ncbi:MAG: AAA family ATPase [Blastocatellia bacterium]